jgi:hypothetical protein
MYYALAGNVSAVDAAVVITVGNFCCFSVFFFGLGHKSPLCCAAMLECFAALHSLSSLQTEGIVQGPYTERIDL